jgi:hypothetical protein
MTRSMGDRYQRFGGMYCLQVPLKRWYLYTKLHVRDIISQKTVKAVYAENRIKHINTLCSKVHSSLK